MTPRSKPEASDSSESSRNGHRRRDQEQDEGHAVELEAPTSSSNNDTNNNRQREREEMRRTSTLTTASTGSGRSMALIMDAIEDNRRRISQPRASGTRRRGGRRGGRLTNNGNGITSTNATAAVAAPSSFVVPPTNKAADFAGPTTTSRPTGTPRRATEYTDPSDSFSDSSFDDSVDDSNPGEGSMYPRDSVSVISSISTGSRADGAPLEEDIVGAYIEGQHAITLPQNLSPTDGSGDRIDGTVIRATQSDIERETLEFWNRYVSTNGALDLGALADLEDEDNNDGRGCGGDDDDNMSVGSTRSISSCGSLGMLLANLRDDMSCQSNHKMKKRRGGRHRFGRRGSQDQEDDDDEEDAKVNANEGAYFDQDFESALDSSRHSISSADRRGSQDQEDDDEEGDAKVNANEGSYFDQDFESALDSSRHSISSATSTSSSAGRAKEEILRIESNKERDDFEHRRISEESSKVYKRLTSSFRSNDSENPTFTSTVKSVTFSFVEIRQYERILTDHPCAYGPAIGLGWNHYRDQTNKTSVDNHQHDLEVANKSSGSTRRRQGGRGCRVLPRPLRELILLDLGYTEKDLAKALRGAVSTKRQRQRTYHNQGFAESVDEAADKAKRKIKRAIAKTRRRLSISGEQEDPCEQWLEDHKIIVA